MWNRSDGPRSLPELEAALAATDRERFPAQCRRLEEDIRRKKQFEKRKERRRRLHPYEYVANLKPLDRAGLIVSLWFIFFPWPYPLVFSLALALPIVGLLLNGVSQPSISTLFTTTSENKLDLTDCIDIPAIAIVIRMLIDFEIDTWGSIILPGAVALGLFLLLIAATHKLIIAKNIPHRIMAYSLLAFHVLLYSYGGVVVANCVYDRSDPLVYETTILGKDVSGGRSKTYRFTVEPWGHHEETEMIRVPFRQYRSHEVGDKVAVALRQGLFGIKWYRVE